MSDSVLIAFISTLGVTFFTGLFAIIQQAMANKKTSSEQRQLKKVANEVKEATDESRHENRDGFDEIKSLVLALNESIKSLDQVVDLMLRERLRFLLRLYQNEVEVSYADKEIIVDMNEHYKNKGYNGTIKTMFENFDKIKVV